MKSHIRGMKHRFLFVEKRIGTRQIAVLAPHDKLKRLRRDRGRRAVTHARHIKRNIADFHARRSRNLFKSPLADLNPRLNCVVKVDIYLIFRSSERNREVIEREKLKIHRLPDGETQASGFHLQHLVAQRHLDVKERETQHIRVTDQ